MIRRSLLGLALAAAGGLPPRRPDQYPRQRGGLLPAPQSNVVIGSFVVVATPGGGIFVYSPTAGAGNLIASIAPQSGTDRYGNAYHRGIMDQDPSNTLQTVIDGGSITMTKLSGALVPPRLTLDDLTKAVQGETIVAPDLVRAPLMGTVDPATFNTPETWHNLGAMSNGWSAGGHAQYKLSVEGELWLSLKDILPGATIADGTIIWSAANGLPAAYRAANAHRVACYADAAPASGQQAAIELQTNGSIQCYGIAVAATRIDYYGVVPISA